VYSGVHGSFLVFSFVFRDGEFKRIQENMCFLTFAVRQTYENYHVFLRFQVFSCGFLSFPWQQTCVNSRKRLFSNVHRTMNFRKISCLPVFTGILKPSIILLSMFPRALKTASANSLWLPSKICSESFTSFNCLASSVCVLQRFLHFFNSCQDRSELRSHYVYSSRWHCECRSETVKNEDQNNKLQTTKIRNREEWWSIGSSNALTTR